MTLMLFLLSLAAAVCLLLFAIQMMQGSIERLAGASFRSRLARAADSRPLAATLGGLMAFVMQSATAATLLAAQFVMSRTLVPAAGLVIALGADLGSALVVQFLSVQPTFLTPLLLLAGGLLSRSERHRTKSIGRLLLGLGLVLLSLKLLGEATAPVRASAAWPAVSAYLDGDLVTGFLLGAFMSLLMHSSVATLLLCASLLQADLLSLPTGLAMMLGVNAGSALLVSWLTRHLTADARRMTLALLALRTAGALLGLYLLIVLPVAAILRGYGEGGNAAWIMIGLHVLFNASILLLGLATARPLLRLIDRITRTRTPPREYNRPASTSALDWNLLDTPAAALAGLHREVLRMGQIVEAMLEPVMALYRDPDPQALRSIQQLDRHVNRSLADVRAYTAKLDLGALTPADAAHARDLMLHAIHLESAGDVISKGLLKLAQEKQRKGLRFSPEGLREISAIHEQMRANLALALNMLMSGDLALARRLWQAKDTLSELERNSRHAHLQRMRDVSGPSFSSSNLHLETLREFTDLNSRISALANPMLTRAGLLRESRLIDAPPAAGEAEADEPPERARAWSYARSPVGNL